MNKKYQDISTYFVSNKRQRNDVDENNSDASTTTTHFYGTNNNNGYEIIDNDVISVTIPPLSVSQHHDTTISISAYTDVIGLYVSNNAAKNNFSLLNRLLTKPWISPSNYNYPKIEQSGKRRSVCHHSWLVRYSWLSYSKMHQGIYCRYCVLFSRKGENQSLGQLINKPLRSLKDATEYLSNHNECNYHKLSVSQATECVSRYAHTNSDVNILLNNINEQQQNENRRILASIIKCTLFLPRQNIAFRGNDENGILDDNNTNPGNFKSLVLFAADAGDQALQKYLNHHQKNATYLSWQTQNELVKICAMLIKNKLLNEVISTEKFYAIIADKTADISGTEKLSISIRFVSDENDISIKEVFLGFVALSHTTAADIAKAITTFIQASGLKIEKNRGIFFKLLMKVYSFYIFSGQGYDGANVVAGRLGGVQKLIRDIVPRANYVHCSKHSLNLVLAVACKLQQIKIFFGLIKSIISFINGSSKRKSMLAKAIESTNNETKRRHLVKLCETRWVDKHTSIIVFKQVFFGFIIGLDYLVESSDSETSGLARSYGKALTDIDFVIPLIVVNRVFCITKPYAEQLQKPTCDLLKCYQSMEHASTYLAELIYDDNQVNVLYNEFTKFIELNEIDNCLSRAASRRYESVKDYFIDVYRTFITTTIHWMTQMNYK
ncbi:unnamed protein product, partial [Rotaria socialis]